ncbi:MAG: ABC transporter permease subunit [Litoreibacter sp.]
MTTLSDPHASGGGASGGFKPSMLLNDTRYRSLTFQFIALVAIIAAMAFVGGNLVRNLTAAGLNISYDFLGYQAGYDIGQRLIEYDSQSTHGRAAMVGLLNTLLVALMACVTATVIGVIAGVLRLSNNWIVAKIMSFYVEIFRNVPVLIWLLIILSIYINSAPQPRAFRGDDATASMKLFDSIAITNRGIYLPSPTFGTGGMLVVAVFIASIVGIFLFRKYARKQLYDHGKLISTFWPSVAIFFVPAILAQLVLGNPVGLEYPELKGFNFRGGLTIQGPLLALWFALSIYTGAFIAENVRAGIVAVAKGQSEAAGALGLRPGRIMNLVVLPQALRVIIPPLISQYLNITKNSSLAIAVGYMDLTGTLGGITLLQTGRAIESVLLLMMFYLSISLLISFFMNIYNNSMKLKER